MATKSIGSSGRDYATLALWAAYVNALSLSAPEVGEMYNDSEFSVSSTLTIGGWTGGSATNTVTLKCASGHSFRDHADKLTNPLRYNQSKGVAVGVDAGNYNTQIQFTTDYTIVDGIQFHITAGASGFQLLLNGTDGVIQNCIVVSESSRHQAMIALFGTNCSATNCALIARGDTRGVQSNASGVVTGCTIVAVGGGNTRYGIWSEYSGVLVKNCAVSGFGDNYFGTASASSTNNATSAGSFSGTNFGSSGQVSVAASEWVSLTSGTEDLRLNNAGTKLLENGATVGPANDIVGTSRPQSSAYDIGCWEGGAVIPTVWEFIGVGTVSQIATATDHTLNEPAGVQAGDLLVACITSRIASTTPVTLPSGGEWFLVDQQNNSNTQTNTSATPSGLMAYCIRGASAPNLTFVHPTNVSVARGYIVAYRNINTSSPLHTNISFTTATNTTAVSGAGLTTTASYKLIVAICCGGQEASWSNFNAATDPNTSSGTASNETGNPLAGDWQERVDTSTTTGADTSIAIFDAIKENAGATGGFSATASLAAAHVVIAAAFNFTPTSVPDTSILSAVHFFPIFAL